MRGVGDDLLAGMLFVVAVAQTVKASLTPF